MRSEDLQIAPEGLFPLGASGFLDTFPGLRETEPRIYVKFRPIGVEVAHLALLDTGGHYCILNQELAGQVAPHLTEHLGRARLRTARGPVEGDLYVHEVKLIAELGEPLSVDSILFIAPEWRAPSFLGYMGFLDRLRFAVDPSRNRFFFGPLD